MVIELMILSILWTIELIDIQWIKIWRNFLNSVVLSHRSILFLLSEMVRMPIVSIHQRCTTNKILYVQTCNEKKTIGSSPSNLLSIEHKEIYGQ